MKTKDVLGAVRRHPGRVLAICVPVVAASVFTGTSMASAQPEATLAVSPAPTTAAPAPFVPNPVSSLPGTRDVKYPRDIRKPEAWNTDGCDHDYGQGGVCVPWQIPGSSPEARCAWLKANDFGPLKVYGTNRQNLPENSAGYVCATGTRNTAE